MGQADTDFRFEVQAAGAELTVLVFGDFDMAGVLRLETELEALTQGDRVSRMTIDLAGVSFIDSTALGLIIDLDARARRGEFELSLLPGPRHVQRVFEVTHLTETLPFAERDE